MDLEKTNTEQLQSIQQMIIKERKKDTHNETKKEKKDKEKKEGTGTKKYKLKIVEKLEKKLEDKPVEKPTESPKPKKLLFEPPFNKIFIELLEQLEKLMRKNRDMARQLAYKRAAETIRGIPDDINNVSELEGKKFIGPTITSKFKEYLETGTLNILEKEKEKPEYAMNAVYDAFSNIYGVGPKKAKDLIDMGIKSIEELKERQGEVLNESQRAGLKYYEDILERIPRAEIDKYNDVFRKAFDKAAKDDPEAKYEIVGSYRRGLTESGDIDMIITSNNKGIFKDFIDNLIEEKIILVVLSRGQSKCLVIAQIPGSKKARRVDFLYTSLEEFPFAILYFTGSKEFNTVMRSHALSLGFSLNEHGLSKKESGKKKEELVSHKFRTENDIFDYLYLDFKVPTDRIGARAVVKKGSPIKAVSAEPEDFDMTNWKRGSYEESCDEVCAKDGMTCKKEDMDKLDSANKITALAKKTGAECLKHNEIDSTPFLEDTGGKGCWYVKKDKKPTKKWCTKKSKKWNTNLCPCEKEEKKVRRSYKKREKQPDIASLVPIVLAEKQQTEPMIEPLEPPIKNPARKTLKIRPPKNTKIEIENKDVPVLQSIPENMKTTDVKTLVSDFKKHGMSTLEKLTEKQIESILIASNDAYYNKKDAIMTDNEYDIVKEYMERKYPKNEVLEKVGAPITKNKVKLPFNMPSMDKIKPDSGALAGWKSKYSGPYVLSCKLDGVSGMYVSDETKLYTRGDGTVGQDITHLLRVLNLPKVAGLVVRGEFIIPKAVFETKYKDKFANPRNLVSGIVNSKTIDEKTKDLHFVAYEVIQPRMKPSEQMETLKKSGFEVVQNKSESDITNESLSDVLKDWRTSYKYEIDGVIVINDHIHARKDGNPEYAFAFKMVMSDQMAEAKVVDVIWEASKAGYLKPRVRIEPIRLGGVTIEYATGFNGKFIEENMIGIGAVIQIIRSGDVIPHIKSVTTPAETAKMPDVAYHWTDTHVDIVLDNVSEDLSVREKNITAFFTTLDVDGLSGGNVKRIMKAGFDTIPKILHMEKKDFETVEGFKQKMVDKIYDGIKTKVAGASLLNIMVASNLLGRGLGERKMRPMLDAEPDILVSKDTSEQKIAKLRAIPGIGPENAKSFVANIPVFLGFLKECGLQSKLDSLQKPSEVEPRNELVNVDVSNPLYGKHIVMTKTRDATVIEKIKAAGGVLDDNIGKSTFLLIVKTKADVSNKTKYANDHGIEIMTPEEFNQKY